MVDDWTLFLNTVWRRCSFTCVVIAFAAVTTGCSASSDNDLSGVDFSLPESYAGYSVSQMIEAYAPLVEELRENTSSDFALKVLEDGYVTDKEYTEALGRYKKCLVDAGYKGVEFYSDGSHSVITTDEKEAELRNVRDGADDPDYVCAKQTGELEVESLYASMRQNPLNENPLELIAQCLVDKKAVESSTTGNDIEKLSMESMRGVDVPLFDTPEWRSCLADPLGIRPDEQTEIEVP